MAPLQRGAATIPAAASGCVAGSKLPCWKLFRLPDLSRCWSAMFAMGWLAAQRVVCNGFVHQMAACCMLLLLHII
jgi:hypothetical protein